MNVVVVYNMKGGVGKTTAAVNLSYVTAAAGRRTLLWDLDPQAASSFAFRIRPRVAGFSKKSLESGQALAAAIKETDYANLDLLPADFAYRKLDRLLDRLGKPERVVAALLDALGRDYDTVYLDCPAGFSLLTEGVLAAADAVLVPTIPTVLSLRTVARLIKWARRADSRAELVAFFNMVDRRKTLHRRACEWSEEHPGIFLAGQIPYASVVEQMAVRRLPLAVFAAREPAAIEFARIAGELQTRLQRQRHGSCPPSERWVLLLRAIESLIVRLESPDAPVPAASSQAPADVDFVHTFDTDGRDLQRAGYVLELRERPGNLHVVAARSGRDQDGAASTSQVDARIDSVWARQILSGATSPLSVLQVRLPRPLPGLVDRVCALVAGQTIRRIDSRVASQADAGGPQGLENRQPDRTHALVSNHQPG